MVRGGKREGAGRKKSEPTKRMSIPLGLISDVEKLIDDHKTDKLKPIPESLVKFITMFPEYENNRDVLAYVGVLFDDWEELKKVPRQHRKMIIKIMQKM